MTYETDDTVLDTPAGEAQTSGQGFTALRFVGIRHRVKQTKDGQARPTQVCIRELDGTSQRFDLKTEQDELDWLQGRAPSAWAWVKEDDPLVLSGEILSRHILRDKNPKKHVGEVKIPLAYDGYQAGDCVALIRGGSGSTLAFALTRKGSMIGAQVQYLSPAVLHDYRVSVGAPVAMAAVGDDGDEADNAKITAEEKLKDGDSILLAQLLSDPAIRREHFRVIDARTQNEIILTQLHRQFRETQKAQIATGQRLRARLIGQIFCSPDGLYPEGAIEDIFEAAKANDAGYQALESLLADQERELTRVLELHPVWIHYLKGIEGVGTRIAIPLLAGIGDISRFSNAGKLKAYVGAVPVLPDGTKTPRGYFGTEPGPAREQAKADLSLMRRRKGVRTPANGDIRAALYQLSEQAMLWRPKSPIGLMVARFKAMIRLAHPVEEQVVQSSGKVVRRFYPGHVNKSSRWHFIGWFVEDLYTNWKRLDAEGKLGNVDLSRALAPKKKSWIAQVIESMAATKAAKEVRRATKAAKTKDQGTDPGLQGAE